MNIDIKTSGPSDGSAFQVAPVTPSDATRLADLEQELSQTRDRWMRSEVEIEKVRARAAGRQ
jgi:hypothetical protein